MPSQTTITRLPGACSSVRDRKMALGFFTSLRPCSSMAKTPSSLTAPKRFFWPRRVRKRESAPPSSSSEASIMCSSTLGPARVPSLVTCPTSSSTVSLCLAKRVSAAADSRTWATPPGAEAISSRCMVWMESMIRISGRSRSATASTVSTLVSASILSPWVGSCRRWARIATWESDSSPVT